MNLRKKWYLIPAFLLLISGAAAGCGAASGATPTPASSTGTVQRGDLAITITGSGNLAYSRSDDLAFEMAGIVDEVLVQAGDSVTEGQEIARLDTEAREDQIVTLERQLTAAQRALAAAEEKIRTAERGVTLAERQVNSALQQVDVKERALIQAQISLKNAQSALDKALGTYTGPDIETAEAGVNKAKAYLEYALNQRAAGGDPAVWDQVVLRAQASLDAAQKTLDALVTSSDSEDVAIKRLQLEIAQGSERDARTAIETAGTAVDDAGLAVKDAERAVEDARAARDDAGLKVDDAQKALDKARTLSPVVKASFAGFVTQVNVKGGDEVKKGTVAVKIADPARFQADIMVSEMDIFQVRQGGEANVQADSLPGLAFPAKVNFISPTATIQQGVVNYKVTVEVEPLQPGQARLTPRPATGQTSPPPTSQAGRSIMSPPGTAEPVALPLKQGLTVSVNILIQQRTDVLLVPTRAISRQGTSVTVQVVKDDGVREARVIKTGLSDYQNTEVTEGLAEGEKVVIQQTATAGTATAGQGQFRMVPGMIR
ncbi:MAG: HlyD family efflux transporter periplasmic adaptor subunit [Chloroflexi bacterium]|nr:HlyD family efflux transporter periplasmic adaptor subunit [Chloroflexota bacterium]